MSSIDIAQSFVIHRECYQERFRLSSMNSLNVYCSYCEIDHEESYSFNTKVELIQLCKLYGFNIQKVLSEFKEYFGNQYDNKTIIQEVYNLLDTTQKNNISFEDLTFLIKSYEDLKENL